MHTEMEVGLTENLSFKLDPIERDEHPYSLANITKLLAEKASHIQTAAGAAEIAERLDLAEIAQVVFSALPPNPNEAQFLESAIHTISNRITKEPECSKLAALLLSDSIRLEVASQGVTTFMESIALGIEHGLASAEIVARASEVKIDPSRDGYFEFFGLKTVWDRYLLRHPKTRKVIETPQMFFARVASGISSTAAEAQSFYDLVSVFRFMPSTPTLFNSGTMTPQLSSCFLLDSPKDELKSIYARYSEAAELSKFSGGIGIAYHRVRSRGSLIKGTNGKSNGIVPWLKTLDSSVSAVNQGGKRKGACCVYLESWHADIEEFLELRNNTGDEARRTHNLNLSNWISDVFMERVEKGETWSLFDPKDVPEFPDLYGDDFRKAYLAAEAAGLAVRTMPARDLYGRMMKCLAETGNGWMNFKDSSNKKCNQTGQPGNVVHLSNLCTEILEVTSNSEVAVCNLGSVNLREHVIGTGKDAKFDFERLGATVRSVVPYLDRVIDLNYYAVPEAKSSNHRWRPIGVGIMGMQDVFFQLGLAFESPEAFELSTRIQEHVYFAALTASNELAKKHGPHTAFPETRAAKGDLQFDLWTENGKVKTTLDWEPLRQSVKTHGLRNSLLLAIAPTATIASIVGSYESIEPQVSNLFKRETMSGEFLQVNKYLVERLRAAGLWDDAMMEELKLAEGSIQNVDRIPQDIKNLFKTAWELSMKSIIDQAAARGAFLDQSQSLNLFMETPNIGKLSSMYLYAWKKGLKTTYYMRSRPATKIAKATVSGSSSMTTTPVEEPKKTFTAEEAVVCSLENPSACEACQ